MAHGDELTYLAARRRWKKKHRGKVYYVGRPCNKSDRQAYREALAEWRDLEARLSAQQQTHQLDERAADPRLNPSRVEVQSLNEVASEMAAEGIQVSAALAERIKADARRHGAEGHPDFDLDPRIVEKPAPDKLNIEQQVARFLRAFRAQVDLGSRSTDRLSTMGTHLEQFMAWSPDGGTRYGLRPVSDLNASMLIDLHAEQAQQVSEGQISQSTGRDRIQVVKQLIRWAWEQELVTLPRNIDSPMIQIAVEAETVKVWDIDEIRALYAAASDRTKLYLLLAANCGMTQNDIATLKRDEWDKKAGTITRARTKTRRHSGRGGSVPVVCYSLWPETQRLLLQEAAKSGKLLLVSEKGTPLVRRELNDKGKVKPNDAIRNAFRRVVAKMNKERDKPIKGTFKLIRKTSANLLAQHREHRHVADLYLGHAPTTIKDRHYTRPPQELLGEAVSWLGEQLDLK